MPVTNGEIKVSESWSLKTRNKGRRAEPSTQAPQNTLRTRNSGSSPKSSVAEGPIVDAINRNKSVSSDKPFTTDGVSLSQKAEPKRRNSESGGRTMDSFSQNPNTNMNRNGGGASKEMGSQKPTIKTSRASVRKYPVKGANARGANAG